VLRTDLSGDLRVPELLARVRETALAAYAHQEVPFEKLVGALDVERDLSRTPLFQVMFALQNALHQETGSSSLSVGPFTLDSSSAEFELILSLVESEQGVTGVWEYNTDLFDRTTIERMVDHYLRLLEAVVRNPRERIS